MKTREQFEFQKLGDRKTGRHQARQDQTHGASLSSSGSSPSPPLRQPVSALEEPGLHLFEASSYPLKLSFCPACAAASHVTPSVYRPLSGLQEGRHRCNLWYSARRSIQSFVVRETSLR